MSWPRCLSPLTRSLQENVRGELLSLGRNQRSLPESDRIPEHRLLRRKGCSGSWLQRSQAWSLVQLWCVVSHGGDTQKRPVEFMTARRQGGRRRPLSVPPSRAYVL